eukprot:6476649-Prymnesium_polylepis.1
MKARVTTASRSSSGDKAHALLAAALALALAVAFKRWQHHLQRVGVCRVRRLALEPHLLLVHQAAPLCDEVACLAPKRDRWQAAEVVAGLLGRRERRCTLRLQLRVARPRGHQPHVLWDHLQLVCRQTFSPLHIGRVHDAHTVAHAPRALEQPAHREVQRMAHALPHVRRREHAAVGGCINRQRWAHPQHLAGGEPRVKVCAGDHDAQVLATSRDVLACMLIAI